MQTLNAPSAFAEPSLSVPDIRQCLVDCHRLVDSGLPEAAAVIAWSAFEAAVRASLTELGQQTEDPITLSSSATGLTAQAVAYGVIDPADRTLLLRFLPARDAAAHGYAASVNIDDLEEVLALTSRTLDELEAGLPEAQGG